ncbi:hypothetical protein Rt10032_c05g2401 [Rhodotorula toruloides]|uniref:Uncharacterized protein n=1 Tax=Rhodotorula toruloides TaxID=5286 RepID=A0A511KG17_RHOTO|nr:hypothetical protein Rt10032_c05g2401 [Rhodotorula toruloides]
MAPLDQDKLADYKQQAMKEIEAAQAYLSSKGADLQSRYVEPAVDALRHHAQQRPLFTTFALVSGVLSFFPILLFTLFAAGTVLAVGGAALVGAAVVIGWLVGSAALLLVGTLVVVGFLGAVATFWIGASYAAIRFLHHLRTADTLPDAIHDFRSEATDLLFGSSTSASHNGTNGCTKVHFNSIVKREGEKDVPVKNGNS